MINKKSLCVVQQKKIGLFTFIIVLSALFSVIVKGTLVANKILQQNQIMDKKSNIGQKRTEMVKIQKAVKYINDANYNKNLKRKSGFYSSFDKQEFIDSVITKMNHEDDFDLLEEENKSKLNLEYSGFMIRINPTSNTDMERHLAKLKSKMIVSNNQNANFSLDTSILKIDFNADYEYVAYKVLEMLKQILPGTVIVKSFSVQPVNEEMKKILYDNKFNNNKIGFTTKLDDRLACTIELEWIFLTGNKPI